MHFMSREWLCRRLRLSPRQSYSLVRSGYGPCVSSAAVLSLVNRSRRNIVEPFTFVPSDILTAEELAATPELAESGLTSKNFLVFTRRENPNNQPPFLRLNKQCTRFVKSLFLAWLEERARDAERTGRRRFV
jgi:hypothetical protein